MRLTVVFFYQPAIVNVKTLLVNAVDIFGFIPFDRSLIDRLRQ